MKVVVMLETTHTDSLGAIESVSMGLRRAGYDVPQTSTLHSLLFEGDLLPMVIAEEPDVALDKG